MVTELRKVIAFEEEIFREGGRDAKDQLKIFGVAAVLENPWKGRDFVEDLSPEINRVLSC